MKANFYLHIDSFIPPEGMGKNQYISRLHSFLEDMKYIADGLSVEENAFIYSNEIYTTYIFDNILLCDFIGEELDRDDADFFFKLLNTSECCSFSIDEIEPLTVYNPDAEECNALIYLNRLDAVTLSDNCLQEGVVESVNSDEMAKSPATDKMSDSDRKYIEFDKYEIVYDRSSWITVRRQILGNHPGCPEEFMERAKAYFPDLTFGDYCVVSISDHLQYVPRKIVYVLSCMNDRLLGFWSGHPNLDSDKIKCAEFAGYWNMDKAGSPQGSKKEKADDYTFTFTDPVSGSASKRKCGLHFKITHVDDNCPDKAAHSAPFHSRIYFSIPKDFSGIYVGSIGKHV